MKLIWRIIKFSGPLSWLTHYSVLKMNGNLNDLQQLLWVDIVTVGFSESDLSIKTKASTIILHPPFLKKGDDFHPEWTWFFMDGKRNIMKPSLRGDYATVTKYIFWQRFITPHHHNHVIPYSKYESNRTSNLEQNVESIVPKRTLLFVIKNESDCWCLWPKNMARICGDNSE